LNLSSTFHPPSTRAFFLQIARPADRVRNDRSSERLMPEHAVGRT
jgi:hypothetical protein